MESQLVFLPSICYTTKTSEHALIRKPQQKRMLLIKLFQPYSETAEEKGVTCKTRKWNESVR